ncbi:19576_t:CDS:2 [Funneliformis geosporum]|nr:19576_t:CDS:2 [Funneliformis geosporum]
MQSRQTWKIKILGVLRFFGYSKKAARNEELEIPPSTTYSDDSDESNSDTEVSINSTSSDLAETINTSNSITSKNLRESYDHRFYWEWIPFNQLSNVQHLANDIVFTAIWLEGPRNHWNNKSMLYVRRKWCKVVLKRLAHSPDNIGKEFINELRSYYGRKRSRCGRIVQIYGITLDPEKNCYMLVTEYHNKRDIRTSLQENYSELTWSDKLRLLHDCAEALLHVHSRGHTHKNLHSGNLLLHSKGTNVSLNLSDLGLYNHQSVGELFGVIPYVAPEVLNGWPITQDADIYGFSMIMFELATGLPPFYDRVHDQRLIFDICERDLRPRYDSDQIPVFYASLMQKCWSTEPFSRPNANEILFIIKSWNDVDFPDIQFKRENFKIHPDAIYNSRPLADLISREFELRDQFRDEAELSEQNEVEESSKDSFEESSEDYEDDEQEKSESESESELDDECATFEQTVETKIDKFPFKLELNLGESSTSSFAIHDEIKNERDTTTTSSDNDSSTESS